MGIDHSLLSTYLHTVVSMAQLLLYTRSYSARRLKATSTYRLLQGRHHLAHLNVQAVLLRLPLSNALPKEFLDVAGPASSEAVSTPLVATTTRRRRRDSLSLFLQQSPSAAVGETR